MRFSHRRRGAGVQIDRARSGDQRAVADLYREHVATVRGYIDACGAAEPDELTSEVFATMVRDIDRFKGGPAELRRWLITIAHHYLADHRGGRPTGSLNGGGSFRADSEADPPAERGLIAGFGELEAIQREVLALRFLADLSVAEVAAIIEHPIEEVEHLQAQALAALRDQVPVPAPGRREVTP